MLVFLKNIFRSIRNNWLSIFSLVFFISVISTVYSAATNLVTNLSSNVKKVNQESGVHDAVINPDYGYGNANFVASDQPQYRKHLVTQINSTAAQVYIKNQTTQQWSLNGQAVPLHTKNAIPPACFPTGSPISDNIKVYNFLNPEELVFNNQGQLISQQINVTSQCGVGGIVSESTILDPNSPNPNDVQGYNYVKNLFDDAGIKKLSESEDIYENNANSSYLIEVKVSGDKKDQYNGRAAITKILDQSINTLNPNYQQWTKGFKKFYDLFNNSPKTSATSTTNNQVNNQTADNNNPVSDEPNPLEQFNISDFDKKIAENYLKPFISSTNIDDLNKNDLINLIKNNLSSYKLTDSNDKKYDLNKIAQNIYKSIFYQWKIDHSNDFSASVQILKASSFAKLKSYIGQENEINQSSKYTEYSPEKKFIFSATDQSSQKGFINFINQLNDQDKNQLYDVAVDSIKNSITTQNNAHSSDQISLIKNFIINHKLWTVDNVLNDFVFKNPINNKNEKYKINRNELKSIIVNQAKNDANVLDANNDDLTNNSAANQSSVNNNDLINYKVIQSNYQPDNNYVNRLIIQDGNPLFYTSSYSNYQILQNWLNLRKINKNLTPSQETPFIKMLLRAKFSSQKIYDVFSKYLRYLEVNNDSSNLNTDATKVFLNPQEREQIRDYLNQIQNGFWDYNGYQLNFNFTSVDFFKTLSTISIDLQKITQVPAPAYLNDTISNFVIVSPELARKFNKTPISDEAYNDFKLLANSEQLNQNDWEFQLNNFILNPKNARHILDAGGLKSIIVGVGITADFVFPSISLFSLIPDPNHEALIYTNANGYNRFLARNPAGTPENYIAISVPESIRQVGLVKQFIEQLKPEINNYASTGKIFYDANDTSMTFSASAYRLVFVDNIINVLYLVSYLLIAVVVVLTLFGVIVLVKRYFKNNSKVFGNLGANGISKLSIIVSSIIFVTIPAVIGPIIGYFIGLFTQDNLFNILSNYWFLDSAPVNFNFLTLVYYILIPLGVLSLVTIIASGLTIKASSLVLMRENPIFKQNKFSLKVNSLFNTFTPLWKFRLIVATNSLPRIFLLSGMSSLMVIILIFVFSNIGQFNKIANSEITTKKFDYAVQYNSNTNEYLQTPLLSYNQLGQTYLNPIEQNVPTIFRNSTNSNLEVFNWKINQENPLLVSTNINNYFENSVDKFGAKFNNELKTDPNLAFNNLNQALHFDPAKTNRWAQDSILSNFLLRSEWDANKKHFKSNSLPIPDVNNAKQHVFYASSEAANSIQSKANTANTNIINLDKIREHENAFNPNIKNQKEFYYADYIPVNQEDTSPNKNNVVLAADGTPLFKPLADLYQNKAPLLKNNNGTSAEYVSYTTSSENEYSSRWMTTNQDFHEFSYDDPNPTNNNDPISTQQPTQKKIKLPHLSRLYRDNANYWIFSIDDRNAIQTNLNFLRNRVITKLLLDNTIKVNEFGLKLNINMWDIIRPILNQASPAVLNQIEKNHIQLIRHILSSRYGAFFLNRFFTMHQLNNPVNHFNDGDLFNGHPSYLIRPEDITKVNSINHNQDSSISDPKNNQPDERKITPGLYYLDSSKTVYLYLNPLQDSTKKENKYSVFALFRPDYLYLVLSILNDPEFAAPGVGPAKISFGDQVVLADYNDPKKQWTTTGVPEVDAQQNVGLTASTFSDQAIDYTKTVNGDQTFTYLKGHFDHQENEDLITGIKQDLRGSYLHLTNENNQVINHLLYQELTYDQDNNPIYPIIVNLFAAKKHNLNLNQLIRFIPNNTTNRFINKINKVVNNKPVTFKIVGFNNTYYQNAYFISQRNANLILGLNPEYGYNGIFTKHNQNYQQPIQFSDVVSIYSQSGIYAPVLFDPSSAATKELILQPETQVGLINIPSNLEILKAQYNIPVNLTTIDDIINFFRDIYGESVLNPAVTNLNDSNTTNLLFDKLSTTIQSLISIILIIFVPLLVIMVMMVTSLVIDDLKQLSVIMIMLGFNNWENAITVLTYLIPVLSIASIVGIPLSIIFLQTYVGIVLNVISIFLPIKLVYWYFLSSIGILLAIFTFAFAQSYLKLKKIFLPIAMKSFGD
ncbi:ABC3 transporter permease domain-containing protein [[Mycoplasma] cavipharyngis]|uniref:FtsX-like permease family protein n=1 Tax=[Mycoplasma] cavipharyngis TaxID=92757 RepID=UPI0037044403